MTEVFVENKETKTDEEPAVVFVPGFLCGEDFVNLTEYDYDLVVSPTTEFKGHQNIAERHYYELHRAILEKYGPDRKIKLVGESMGAVDVLHYAALHPDRVEQVICISPHGFAQTETHADLPTEVNTDVRRITRYDTHKHKVRLKDRAILAKQAAQITINNAIAATSKPYEARIGMKGPTRGERLKQAIMYKMGGAALYGIVDLKRVWDEIGYATFDNQLANDSMKAIAEINEQRLEEGLDVISVDIVISPRDEFGTTMPVDSESDFEDISKEKWSILYDESGAQYKFVRIASFNHPDAIHEATMLSTGMTRGIITDRTDRFSRL